jgi:hypothetical protein
MKKALKRNVCLSIGVLWFSMAVSLSAETIYDNSVNDLQVRFTLPTSGSSTYEVGDEITLAGTSRYVSYFDFEYWASATAASFAGDVQARVRFYENNGTPYHGYNTPNATPFWDSGWFSNAGGTIFHPTDSYPFRDTIYFTTGVDFPTGLLLPSSDMTWTVQFQGLGAGDVVGLDLYNPPDIGQAVGDFGDYWQNDGVGNWTLLTNSAGIMNFGATMQATPEPSSLALSLLGGVSLLIAMRRFRRNE